MKWSMVLIICSKCKCWCLCRYLKIVILDAKICNRLLSWEYIVNYILCITMLILVLYSRVYSVSNTVHAVASKWWPNLSKLYFLFIPCTSSYTQSVALKVYSIRMLLFVQFKSLFTFEKVMQLPGWSMINKFHKRNMFRFLIEILFKIVQSRVSTY